MVRYVARRCGRTSFLFDLPPCGTVCSRGLKESTTASVAEDLNVPVSPRFAIVAPHRKRAVGQTSSPCCFSQRGPGGSAAPSRNKGAAIISAGRALDEETRGNSVRYGGIVPSCLGEKERTVPYKPAICGDRASYILFRIGFAWSNSGEATINSRFSFVHHRTAATRRDERFSLRLRRKRGFVQQTEDARSLAALAIKDSFSFLSFFFSFFVAAIRGRAELSAIGHVVKSAVLFTIRPQKLPLPSFPLRRGGVTGIYLLCFAGNLSRDGSGTLFGVDFDPARRDLDRELARTRIQGRLLKIDSSQAANDFSPRSPENLIVSSDSAITTTTKSQERRSWTTLLLEPASQPDRTILFSRRRCSCRSPECWRSSGHGELADCERLVCRFSAGCALARAATSTADCPGSGSRKSAPCPRPRPSLRARSRQTGCTVSQPAYLSKSFSID